MTKQVFKTVGEGGAHAHKISPTKIETDKDGIHKHIFFVNDRILMTDLSGAHVHTINIEQGITNPEKEKHTHSVAVHTVDGTVAVPVKESQGHSHEMQTEMTTLSGVHRHAMELGGESYISLIPTDLINELMEAAKTDKHFCTMNIKRSEEPMEMDFSLVKKLNQSQFKEILQKAVESSIIKRMTNLGEGLRIESLIISKERFADVGVATRFVLDQGLDIKSSQVLTDRGVFTFQIMSREAFEESTLQRIRITEGVEAVIGFLAVKEEVPANVVATSETGASLTDVQQTVAHNDDDALDSLLSETIHDKIEELTEGKETMGLLKQKFDKAFSQYGQEEEEVQKSFKASYEILSKNEEKRLIMGPVLVPDTVDLQDDIVSASEIEKACHGYMIKMAYRDEPDFLKELGFRNPDAAGGRGFQHMDFSRKMAVVETFISPVDMEINGRNIIKGTWVMTMKVFDDEVWNLVKTGKITGFSIGGHSKSRPAKLNQ